MNKVIFTVLLLAADVAALELGSPSATPLGEKYREQIVAVNVPPRLLPPTCRLAREVRKAIFPMTTNPFVTEDPALIAFVSGIGFGGNAADEVSAAVTALYYDTQPQNEVGVWALKFRSAEAAARARKALTAPGVLVRGTTAVTVWRDNDAGSACQRAIQEQLVKNGFSRWTGP
jgi:hypothetical protein